MASVAAKPPGRWRSLSLPKKIAIALLVLVVLLALAAWIATIVLRPHPPTPEALTKAMKAQAALTGGAQVYATHCAYCHDRGFGPPIAGRNLPPEAVAAFVRTGPAMMPAFPRSQVSDADIAAVASYLNGLPVDPEPGKAESGK